MASKEYNHELDGITQSLTGTFLDCREKAKLYLDGWIARGTPLPMTYGTFGHGCLQFVYENFRKGNISKPPSKTYIEKMLRRVWKIWREENPRASTRLLQEAEYSMAVHAVVLSHYFRYWDSDFKSVEWLRLEGAFKLPLRMNDKYKTFLRGKMDGVFREEGLWLFETKFKGLINEADVTDTLNLDLQIYFYTYALWKLLNEVPVGVRYNIVRRPNIYQRKGESLSVFVKRVDTDVEKRPDWYFYRYKVPFTEADLERWIKEFKGIIKDFIRWRQGIGYHYKNPGSCLTRYGRCQYLNACAYGDFSGLERRVSLFTELESEL